MKTSPLIYAHAKSMRRAPTDADGTNGGSTAQVFANVGVGQVFTVNDFMVT